MKPRILRACLIPLLVAVYAPAQETPKPQPAPAPAASPAPAARPLMLWKAVSGKHTAWMFGSVHIGSPEMYPLPKTVEDAFAGSSTLIVEVDLNKVDMQQLAMSMMAEGSSPPDDNLWNHISPTTRKHVEMFCEKNSMPAEFASHMKPWMLTLIAAVLPFQKLGLDPKLGLDQHFLNQARDTKKKVEQLESAEWQMKLFASLSPELQEQLLDSAVDMDDDPKAQAEELIANWKSGDIAKLDATMTKSMSKPPEVGRKLRDERNPRMADAVEACLKQEDRCFMVVGAAHLVGANSVVSLLEKRGIKVEQMTAAQ